jgi:para-nitrobenzyl esterase
VALAADAAPAAAEGLGEAGAAVEEGCTTSAVLTSSGILCVLAQEVAAPSKGDPGKRGSAFLGIPYGESTAGKHRWAPPVPFKRQPVAPGAARSPATRFGPSCLQALKPGVHLELSGDCLNLNVWTPIPLEQVASVDPLSVMFFLYGDSFVDGNISNPLFDGRNLVSIGDVVVVTLNHRLGALGFLAGIDGLKGNYGFVDHSVPGTASNR